MKLERMYLKRRLYANPKYFSSCCFLTVSKISQMKWNSYSLTSVFAHNWHVNGCQWVPSAHWKISHIESNLACYLQNLTPKENDFAARTNSVFNKYRELVWQQLCTWVTSRDNRQEKLFVIDLHIESCDKSKNTPLIFFDMCGQINIVYFIWILTVDKGNVN